MNEDGKHSFSNFTNSPPFCLKNFLQLLNYHIILHINLSLLLKCSLNKVIKFGVKFYQPKS